MRRFTAAVVLPFIIVVGWFVSCVVAQDTPAQGGGGFSGGAIPSAVTFPDGSSSAPSVAFTNAPTRGFWKKDASTIGVAGTLDSSDGGYGAVWGQSAPVQWFQRTRLLAGSVGNLIVQPYSGAGNVTVQLGGDTSSFPMLKRVGADIQARLADDSGFANFHCGNMSVNSGPIAFGILGSFGVISDGVFRVRDQSNAPGSLLVGRGIRNNTTSYSVLSDDSNQVITNAGASGSITESLPGAVAGLTYTFVVAAAQAHVVDAAAGDVIRFGDAVTASSGNITCSTQGASVTVVAIDADTWVVVSSTSTWTVN